MTFQQKWIFLNKVLHELKIQFPSSDLVGKGGEAGWTEAAEQGGAVAGGGASSHPPSLLPVPSHRTPVSRP